MPNLSYAKPAPQPKVKCCKVKGNKVYWRADAKALPPHIIASHRTFFRSYIFRLCIFSSTQNFVCAIFRPRRFSSVLFFVDSDFRPRIILSVPFSVHANFSQCITKCHQYLHTYPLRNPILFQENTSRKSVCPRFCRGAASSERKTVYKSLCLYVRERPSISRRPADLVLLDTR